MSAEPERLVLPHSIPSSATDEQCSWFWVIFFTGLVEQLDFHAFDGSKGALRSDTVSRAVRSDVACAEHGPYLVTCRMRSLTATSLNATESSFDLSLVLRR